VHMPAQAQLPPGVRPDLDGGPIIIPAGNAPSGTAEGELGWLLCLYNDQSYCMADADDPGDAAAAKPDGTDVVLVEQVATGLITLTIWEVLKNAQKIYKFVKKFWYSIRKAKHVGFAAGDGGCMGDWAYDQDSTLGNCNSAHGIYWQLQPKNGSGSAFRMWDTYAKAKGDMIASSLNDGTPLFVHSPEDWSTWTGIAVCYVTCDP
jgi:hypothetical protein